MPRGVRRIVLVLAAVVASLAAAAAVAAPPAVDAEAYLVVNGQTGEVLASRNAAERVPMASITKLMTVLVALEHARPDDVVTVGAGAASVGESTINLRAGERLTVGDLVTAALVQSANDAATALAAGVADGSVERFVGWMNEKAAALGLHETHFVNPSGLDAPGHVSSARDLTRLARIAMRNPVVRDTVREQAASIGGGRSVSTWNDLLGAFPGTFGVKTGHTSGAGWSEVAAARRNGVTVYATILGGPSRCAAERGPGRAALLGDLALPAGRPRRRAPRLRDRADRLRPARPCGWSRHERPTRGSSASTGRCARSSSRRPPSRCPSRRASGSARCASTPARSSWPASPLVAADVDLRAGRVGQDALVRRPDARITCGRR